MLLSRDAVKLLRLNRLFFHVDVKRISVSQTLYSFYENDRRGGDYPYVYDKPLKQIIKEVNKAFIVECKKFWQETVDRLQQDRKMYMHGDTDVFWRFESEDVLKNWRVTSDKKNNEGNSDCNFIINDKKKAVFYGTVDLTPPKDGKKRFSGYCGIKSTRKKKSFLRDDCYQFGPFTHLELRVRGDGRTYLINLSLGMYYDVNWFAMFTHAIYTHGGPYWQTIRIPFSKFFFTSKGRIQDKQQPVPKDKIDSIGITCAGVAGPFKLEIDYIGCHVDWRYTEKFAYELYKMPKYYVSY